LPGKGSPDCTGQDPKRLRAVSGGGADSRRAGSAKGRRAEQGFQANLGR